MSGRATGQKLRKADATFVVCRAVDALISNQAYIFMANKPAWPDRICGHAHLAFAGACNCYGIYFYSLIILIVGAIIVNLSV